MRDYLYNQYLIWTFDWRFVSLNIYFLADDEQASKVFSGQNSWGFGLTLIGTWIFLLLCYSWLGVGGLDNKIDLDWTFFLWFFFSSFSELCGLLSGSACIFSEENRIEYWCSPDCFEGQGGIFSLMEGGLSRGRGSVGFVNEGEVWEKKNE